MKRTLINQLFAFICWIFMTYLLVGKTGDILISLFAPLPPWFCYLQAYLKSLSSISLMLTIDTIMITRYCFIFWLQNPASVNDDFWKLFLCTWTTGLAMVTQFVYFFWPGWQPVHIYICMDWFPTSKLENKTR